MEEKEIEESKFSLWLGLCCAGILGLVGVLSLLHVLGSWGLYGLILLCPLFHFIFLRKTVSHQSATSQSRNDTPVTGHTH
jgi:hypothetical protein